MYTNVSAARTCFYFRFSESKKSFSDLIYIQLSILMLDFGKNSGPWLSTSYAVLVHVSFFMVVVIMQAQQQPQQQQQQNHQQIAGTSVILKMNEIQQLSTVGT